MQIEGKYNPPTYAELVKQVMSQLKTKIETTSKQLADGKEWLADAKGTLNASKLMFDSNKYDSLYLWCHGIEKMIKAYGLILGAINSVDLKGYVGHITPKIGIKLVDKINSKTPLTQLTNEVFLSRFSEYSEMIKLKDKISRVNIYKKYIVGLNDVKIDEMVEFCKKTEEELKSEMTAEEIYYALRENKYQFRMFSMFKEFFSLYSKEQITKLIEKLLGEIKLSPTFIHPRMTILSLISSSYLDMSKYPAQHKQELNDESHIFAILPDLFNIGDDFVVKLEEISKEITVKDD